MNYIAVPGIKYAGLIPDGGKFAETEYITNVVCGYFRVQMKELTGTRGKQNISFSRHVCMYFLREETSLTYTEIGKLFKRDHTSSMHGVEKTKDLMKVYPMIKHQIDEIKKLIISSKNTDTNLVS